MPRKARHDSAFHATLTGIFDLFERRETVSPLSPGISLEGLSCMITGANSGIGNAAAVQLARRDCRVLMACRSGIPEAGRDVSRIANNPDVRMAFLDLGDLATVRAFCEGMRKRGERFDIVLINAGVVPAKARSTRDGFDEMFQVNYLANFLLVNTLLEYGIIPNSVFHAAAPENNRISQGRLPRIVFVSSEAHRSSRPIYFQTLGELRDYGMSGSVAEYGYTKLLLSTYAAELGRRLAPAGNPEVAVHSLCPGPVNTRIAREAPGWIQPLLKAIFGVFFRSPGKAVDPILYLAASPDIEEGTGRYLHMMTPKEPDPRAVDADNGRRLWEASLELLRR